MRGRKPVPPYLKLLRGNPGKREIKPGLPVDRPTEVPEPQFLSPYAREEWTRLAGEMARLGCLSTIDFTLFATYCEAVSEWRNATEIINRLAATDKPGGMRGLLVKGDGDSSVQNPLLRIRHRAAAAMLRIASEFGQTPAARARIAMGVDPRPTSKFDGLLQG
jgi:P27 family predicted phage terminase small subunit